MKQFFAYGMHPLNPITKGNQMIHRARARSIFSTKIHLYIDQTWTKKPLNITLTKVSQE